MDEKKNECDCAFPPPDPEAEGCFHVSESCPIHGPIHGFVPCTGTPAISWGLPQDGTTYEHFYHPLRGPKR
jgi:hypothetical protein